MVTNYQRGAEFERKVLAWLIGDNTEATSGYLHSLLADTSTPSPLITPPKLYGMRSAGSRGALDLMISITGPGWQRVLGVQCKLDKYGEETMRGDLKRIERDHGVIGIYTMPGRKNKHCPPKCYPSLEEIIERLLQGVDNG